MDHVLVILTKFKNMLQTVFIFTSEGQCLNVLFEFNLIIKGNLNIKMFVLNNLTFGLTMS